MTNIAVIGSEQFTLGFRLAGIRDIRNIKDDAQLDRTVRAVLRDESVSILVMETGDLEKLESRLRFELVSSVKPTMVAVGAEEDDTLRNKIKQAVGVDLW